MKNKLTPEQINRLKGIKYHGEHSYYFHEGKRLRIGQETLYIILFQYLQMSGVTKFKSRYFKKDRCKNTPKHVLMIDCPLGRGELINALKYGMNNGFLEHKGAHSNLTWHLTEDVLKLEGMQQ